MYDQTSQPPQGASQPADVEERLSGLMSLARKRQAESEAALSRATDAEAELASTRQELAEAKALLASAPRPPSFSPPNPMRAEVPISDPLRDMTWEEAGLESLVPGRRRDFGY